MLNSPGFHDKIRIKQRFPTGKGNAAAGIFVKRNISVDGAPGICRCHRFAFHHPGLRGTDRRTGSAAPAAPPIHCHSLITNNNCILGTAADAQSTPNAFPLVDHQLRSRGNIFRIGTPLAAQRATLQKQDTANARSVMYTEFLNIGHHCLLFHSIPPSP